MEIKSNGGADFKALAKRLRQAGSEGKLIRRDLTRALNEILKPVVEEVQHSARSIKVRGVRGRGSRARERFDAAREMRRIAKAQARGRKARGRRAGQLSGLRASVARGVKSRVQYSGFRYGAQIVVTTGHLPQSQRNLPRHLNNPRGWRHPVHGNREVWVTQYGEPYFERVVVRRQPMMRRAIQQQINQTLRKVR